MKFKPSPWWKTMTDKLTEDDIRKNPLTMSDFRKESTSAHAFWTRDLDPQCHPEAGVKAVLKSGGVVEMSCHECKTLIGCVQVAQGDDKWHRRLAGMKRWEMYATTREAFISQAATCLDELGVESRKLFMRVMSIPGTAGAGVDEESACQRLDKAFAMKVLEEAEKLLKAAQKV